VFQVVRSLRERDAASAQAVIDRDAEIDEREVDIEEECQKILALHQPVASICVSSLRCSRSNAELERIGDATDQYRGARALSGRGGTH